MKTWVNVLLTALTFVLALTLPSSSVSAADLVSIEVTPVTPIVAAGLTRQFTATGVFSDGSILDLTARVHWSSSEHTAAKISNAQRSKGLATGLSAGTTEISARLKGLIGTTALTVTDAELVSIEVTPVTPIVAAGLSRQFTATGVFSDGSILDLTAQVVWSCSDTDVAVISNAPGSAGLATGVSVGTTEIGASLDAVSGSTSLNVTDAILVSIEVTPVTPTVAAGLTRQFAATGVFSDGSILDLTAQVVWSCSDTDVAVISNAPGSAGLATGVSVGTTEIGASLDAVSGSTSLNVTDAILVSIEVTPVTPTVAAGLTRQFAATGVFSDGSILDLTAQVVWSCSDTDVAVISNAPGSAGLATGVSVGTTEIGASLDAVSGSTTLTVTDP